RLAEPASGHVIVDPMCGAATILAETLEATRRASTRPAMVLGGDFEQAAVRAAASNLRRLGLVSLVRWDATKLPLANQCIDRIVTNPPFGKQLGKPDQIRVLYRHIIHEFDRVLGKNGQAVLLVSELDLLKEAAAQVKW